MATEQFSYIEKQLLTKNLKDIRDIIQLSKDSSNYQEYQNFNEREQLKEELDKREVIIWVMRDKLIKLFSYLKNIKKLESFMRGKHDDVVLVVFEWFVKGCNETIDGDLKETAQRMKLLELCGIPIEEEELI